MKRLIFFVTLLVPFLGNTQNLPELIKEYESFCNEIVLDTIKQSGTIMYSYDKKGNQAEAKDTIWNKPSCPEFKEGTYKMLSLVTGNKPKYWATTELNKNFENKSNEPRYSKKVERDFICECKRRKVYPFDDLFWEWLKGKVIEKQN